MATPITADLVVYNQGINIDIESIAPIEGFVAEAYDVANMTITATVEAPADGIYRLVLAVDIEAGTSAITRVVSGLCAADLRFRVGGGCEMVTNCAGG